MQIFLWRVHVSGLFVSCDYDKTNQPKTFDVIFIGARGINRTIIRLVQIGAEYIFLFA